jgi:NifB/MoaA-like Fe-S oxidoreductase
MALFQEIDLSTFAGGRIVGIEPGSVAQALGLRPGDELLAIDGQTVEDVIDVQFYAADEELELLIRRDGEYLLFEAERDYDQSLGLEFAHPTFDVDIRRCNNLCEFCFVLQMSPRFRRTLYVKDDDYRYSFLFGHFVTLTNLSDHDWQRIETMRLSPLYVSVHVTDTDLRRRFLRNFTAPDIMEQLRWLAERRIEVHTQLVIVPGFNDGAWLERSIRELAELWPGRHAGEGDGDESPDYERGDVGSSAIDRALPPHGNLSVVGPKNGDESPDYERGGVVSISVVPVGLTRHHKYGMRPHTPAEAAATLDYVERLQAGFLERFGVRFAYLTDEWYLVAGREVPPLEAYDGQELHENGLGMVRAFLDEWTVLQAEIREQEGEEAAEFRSVTMATAMLFAPTLREKAAEFAALTGLEVAVAPIVNERLGDTITVAGLLMAGDVVRQLRQRPLGDLVVLPRVMFDHPDAIALDDLSPQNVADQLGRPVALADSLGDVWDALRGESRLLYWPAAHRGEGD